MLTPEIRGSDGVGASLDAITSYEWPWGALHWNEWLQLTRDHQADVFTGVILEGPHDWPVRPVGELFYDRNLSVGGSESALLGAIWTATDTLAFDMGIRRARVLDQTATEARLGLTWAVPF